MSELALGALTTGDGDTGSCTAHGLLSLSSELATALFRGEGFGGIAAVLNQRTGFPVTIEDRQRTVLASSPAATQTGSLPPEPLLPPHQDVAGTSVVRSVGGWTATACVDGEVFGRISLIDEASTASQLDRNLLEHAASVVTLEFVRQRSVAATEVTIWGDFLTELLESPDTERVRAHARRLGYNLESSYRAVLVCPLKIPPEELLASVRWAARWLGLRECMTTIRLNGVVMLVPQDLDWNMLPRLVANERDGGVRVGVGGRYGWDELGRSLLDAELALKLTASESARPLVIFDNLGVLRLLARSAEAELHICVEEAIGSLIIYDREHHSELVKTLEAFLHSRGSHEKVAASLYIHRSTLTYRLARIRDLTGADLSDPEQRLQLHLACRAWQVLQALRD